MPTVSSRPTPKVRAREAIEQHRGSLVQLSHDIHANPELCFEEVKAAKWATALLDDAGFDVERGTGGIDTAFVATAGDGPLVIAFCAEYDALPNMGHACGHNVMCGASLGAGIGLARVADDLGVTVKVIGTPAEEGGGGKIRLIEAGAFDGVHAALMAHAMPGDIDLVDMSPLMLAIVQLEVEYRGKSAHAAGMPWAGVNALDAANIAQTAIAYLRQQLPPGDLVHGIVTHGGDAPQAIPDRVVLRFALRARTLDRVVELEERVRNCFEAGALATGCTVEIRSPGPPYAHVEADLDLTRFYSHNAQALGRQVIELDEHTGSGSSTDMGNVTLLIPAIHPAFGIAGAKGIPHQPEFADACATPEADAAMEHAATALAWTAIDAASDTDVRDRLLRNERRVAALAT